ncbi:DUF1453 domain-containing protein [Amycolatopsis acidicola]|uniref:DUF1453 domain-containing protein n=1 Tax=Amycolatopsis acidicola TaxID=2596893 RepID=A0A5N0V1D1_9PSEU|nr:DUF1453 domain-containing protein [Amycolatopsis acidicola]KAA9158099.1 DUF1453 domain-containing protein [Amycolatopsis acidicola]
MSGLLEVVLIIVAIGYVLVRRLAGDLAEAKRMLVLPGVLVVIGISQLGDVRSATAMVFVVVTGLVSVVFGVLRGLSVRVYERDGVAAMRYTGLTIVFWVLNIAAKFGANFLLGVLDRSAGSAAGNTLMLTLGAGLLVEGVIVLAQAMRTGHQIVWQKGRNGQPHQNAEWLDDLQQRFSGGR